jgi:hypothetical protein
LSERLRRLLLSLDTGSCGSRLLSLRRLCQRVETGRRLLRLTGLRLSGLLTGGVGQAIEFIEGLGQLLPPRQFFVGESRWRVSACRGRR